MIDIAKRFAEPGNFSAGVRINRLSSLDPEEIANVDIIKGPSAAALYGTAAANGVVIIKTKRGRLGGARWNAFGELGSSQLPRDRYPTNFRSWGRNRNVTTGVIAPAAVQCRLAASAAGQWPHLLVMTATPIPRTLTLTTYGEMDVSRLDEMPPGRTPVETRVISGERIDEVVEGLGRHIADGKQAYWVCPLVEESEVSDRAAAEARAAGLKLRFGDRIGLVHGRMKPPEKDAVMAAFSSGALLVLVATTVIEVGVDVPNASLIVIEEADRFGLAQLHQLRGRVGRGAERSVCLLLRGNALSETSRARLALMRETNDGFRIAEEDLRLRGGGEVLGTRQSGEARFRLATPEQMTAMIETATDDARLLVDRDGGLEGPRGAAARMALYLFERDASVGLLRAG